MRRLGTIATFVLLLTIPTWAQRGGGGHGGGFGGGHAGGFGGGHAAGFSAPHGGFGGSHMASGRSFNGAHAGYPRGFGRAPYSRFSGTPFLHDGFRGERFNRFGGDRFGRYGFRNCYGYGCGWGYGYPGWGAGWWGWDPGWWGSDTYQTYDQDYYDNLAAAQQMNAQNLEEQRMFRQEEADGDQDAYAPPRRGPRSESPAQPESAREGAPIMPDTVIVFRDHHNQEVQNYAIVGQTLWAFTPQHNQRIPLSEIDVPATVRANDERGLTFRIPAANEAQ